MKRKVLALLLALIMGVTLTSCGGGAPQDTGESDSAAEQAADAPRAPERDENSDLQYILDKGTLIVGVTEFAPIDYQDEDGEWIGFDADMARAFADSIGVEAVFQIVDWDNKVFELNGKTIDVVWNGMTLTDEVRNSMECSNAYLQNAQVVIVKADAADTYQSVESLADLSFAVEAGSAGKEMAEANGLAYTEVADQATALLEVSTGTADAAIVDYLMALAMTGEGTSYGDLAYTVSLNTEEYGVGFRKGSDMAVELNHFFQVAYNNGVMRTIGEAYEIADALIAQ